MGYTIFRQTRMDISWCFSFLLLLTVFIFDIHGTLPLQQSTQSARSEDDPPVPGIEDAEPSEGTAWLGPKFLALGVGPALRAKPGCRHPALPVFLVRISTLNHCKSEHLTFKRYIDTHTERERERDIYIYSVTKITTGRTITGRPGPKADIRPVTAHYKAAASSELGVCHLQTFLMLIDPIWSNMNMHMA